MTVKTPNFPKVNPRDPEGKEPKSHTPRLCEMISGEIPKQINKAFNKVKENISNKIVGQIK